MSTEIIDERIPKCVLAYINNDIEISSDEEETSKTNNSESSGESYIKDIIITFFIFFTSVSLCFYTLFVYMELYNSYYGYFGSFIWYYVLACSTILNFMYYIFLKGYHILETTNQRICSNLVNIIMHSGFALPGYYVVNNYSEVNPLYNISQYYYYSHYIMIGFLCIRSIYLRATH